MGANDDAMMAPDFVALGLGGTNMMAMLWTVATGRRAVGVEMRGDPFLGVHWNIREDFYHQLGLIDQLMLERYGEAQLPRRGNGNLFRLAECFYSQLTVAGDIVADEIIDGFDSEQHIVGTIQHIEFIDDRWRDGLPNRVITVLEPPTPPAEPDPRKIRTDMAEVLDGPSMFQAEAASIQKLLRRYLERIEQLDLDNHRTPRVRLFTHHRVVPADGEGFIDEPDGRKRIRIEALQEFDFKGQFIRVRVPGSEVIDLGVPELFMIAQGFNSSDAKRLGFEQHDVTVDHGDGRGPVVAQADFLAGLLEVLIGGRLRRRISSEFDADGKEYWVRQIAVGHENDPEVGWVLVQAPDFKTFDPIASGLVPADTDPASPEFFATFQQLVYSFYMEQASEILEIPKAELKQVQMIYGPTLFSLIERIGSDALVAPNGVVAGDTFGNGHFLTSGGAMTGMIGHSARVLEYWRARDTGAAPAEAIRRLADGIKADTEAWLQVSAQEYGQAVPINFGAERIEQISKASGIATSARAHDIEAARRQRHALIPLDPSNWRRLFVRNGRVLSTLPELGTVHPDERPEPAASVIAAWKSRSRLPKPGSAKPTSDQNLREGEKTMLRPKPTADQHPRDSEPAVVTPEPPTPQDQRDHEQLPALPSPESDESARTQLFSVESLVPKRAQVYVCLDIRQNERTVHRITIAEASAIVGRADAKREITPEIDLTPYDPLSTVSRQHARIYLKDGHYYIEDLESRNKTRLGDLTLTPHQAEPLRQGDVVYFGGVKATFRLLGTSELPVPWSESASVWRKPPVHVS